MKKRNKLPIGVFDSGLGGLTVVKELMDKLPHEDIIYLGDTARVPYGPRGIKTIRRFSEENTKFLIKKNVKAVVIACNTSSALAGDYIKRKFPGIPVFEVIGAAASDASREGSRIGVIGTYGTVGSNAYPDKILKLKPDAKVFSRVCPLFVPFIEEGEVNSGALDIVVDKYLSVFKNHKIDTLILGCTHYPIIKNLISRKIGAKVKLINPGKSISINVSAYLKKNDLMNTQKRNGDVKYFVTDLTDRFTKMAEMFLGTKISHKLVRVQVD